ncbi:hypothetical protein Scep_019549 [Stephania cephalantha]|uniref:Uncharacterized protein n=1 Tax=Stephania cephalantha TaxID=152367 RepID=A0AAP0NNF3_9MAGN
MYSIRGPGYSWKSLSNQTPRIRKSKQSKEAAKPGTVDVDCKSAPQLSQPTSSRGSRPPCNDFLDVTSTQEDFPSFHSLVDQCHK